VQVDPIKPTLKAPGDKRLKLKFKKLLSSLACNSSLRRYMKVLQNTVMKKTFADKNNQEQLFLGAGGPGRDLEFCIVRPGGLGTGAPTGVVNVIEGEAGSIARADVADFCLGALFEDAFPYVGKVGWCRSTATKPVLTAPMPAALET
jgi:hypothetical protein